MTRAAATRSIEVCEDCFGAAGDSPHAARTTRPTRREPRRAIEVCLRRTAKNLIMARCWLFVAPIRWERQHDGSLALQLRFRHSRRRRLTVLFIGSYGALSRPKMQRRAAHQTYDARGQGTKRSGL